MKTLRLFVTSLFAFLLFSCSGLNLEDNRGTIKLQLPAEQNQTRDIENNKAQELFYTISLLDKSEKEIQKKDGTPGTTITFDKLNEGSYIVLCQCFTKVEDKDVLYAQAKENAQVIAGQSTSVTLLLKLDPAFIPEKTPEQDAEIIETPEEENKEPENTPEENPEVIETPEEENKEPVNTPEEKPEETQTPEEENKEPEPTPEILNAFTGITAVDCSSWDELAEKINSLEDDKVVIYSLSGSYNATSKITIDKGNKILLTASADTTITTNFTDTDLILISDGELVICGTNKANITFSGRMPNSIVNVNGVDAELIIAENVSIKDYTCTNSYAGGAIYMASGLCTISGGVSFTNCVSTASDGGAINMIGGQLYVTGDSTEKLVEFNNCSANKDGGAIYIKTSNSEDRVYLSDIAFGSESGKENICGSGYYSRDIYIESTDDNVVYITGNILSVDNSVEIFANNKFYLDSGTTTSADICITFNDDIFIKNQPILLQTEAYSEDLTSHIKVRSLSNLIWKSVNENGVLSN